MWKINFTNRARKDLLSLEKELQARIISKLEKSASAPQKSFEALVGADYSKLSAGDYRIIAVLDADNSEISVRRIGHWKNIYKQI